MFDLRLLFQVVPFLFWLAMAGVFIHTLALRRRWQIAVALVSFLATQKFLFFRFMGGDAFVPDLPCWLINAMGWSYAVGMMVFTMWLLPPYRAFRKKAWVCLAIAVGIASWGMYESVRTPDVREVEVAFENLPPAFDGYRIVQLTDLHASTAARRGRIARIVRRTNGLNPDLVAITGDFVDGPPTRRKDDLEPLKGLKARDGVFGCTGNHEFYGPYLQWRPIYASFGIRMLEDAWCPIRRGDDVIQLGGVMDRTSRRWNHSGRIWPISTAETVYATAPEGGFRVLLKHNPECPHEAEKAHVALQLSGHTHGGAILGMDRVVAWRNGGYVRGLYEYKGVKIYVSRGTGQWAGFPLRLGVPAEITCFTLRRSHNFANSKRQKKKEEL